MCGEHDVLVGKLRSPNLSDDVRDRHFAQVFRFRGEPKHGLAATGGKAVDQTVVLTTQLEGGCVAVVGIEHAGGPVRPRPERRHDPECARRLHLCVQVAPATVLRPGGGQVLVPGAVRLRARLGHGLERAILRELAPLVVGAAGGLREGEHHPFAAYRPQKGLPVRGRAHLRQDGHTAFHRLATRPGAPRQNAPFQRAHPWGHQVHMACAPVPSLPGAVRHRAGLYPPAGQHRDRPFLGALHMRRAGEPGPDGVEQHMGHGLEG